MGDERKEPGIYSLSVVYRYCAVFHHNLREHIPENADGELTRYNDVLLKPEGDPEEVFNRFFEEDVKDYNTRKLSGIRADGRMGKPDRKEVIDNYYRKIRSDRNGVNPFVEMVVQVGNRKDNPSLDRESEIFLASQKIYRAYFAFFKAHCPALHPVCAVIHNDEPMGTPHMHLDFIPCATGERGLRRRCSFDGAIRQTVRFPFPEDPLDPVLPGSSERDGKAGLIGQGEVHEGEMYGKKYAISEWKADQRRLLTRICLRYGVRTHEPFSGRRASLSVKEYKDASKRIQRRVEDLIGERDRVLQELEALREEKKDLRGPDETSVEGRESAALRMDCLKEEEIRKIRELLKFYEENPVFGRVARLSFEKSCIPENLPISSLQRSEEEIRALVPDAFLREILWDRTWAVREKSPLREPGSFSGSEDWILRNVRALHGSSGVMETSRGIVEASVVGSGFRILVRPSPKEEYTVIVPFSLAAHSIRKWREEEEEIGEKALGDCPLRQDSGYGKSALYARAK